MSAEWWERAARWCFKIAPWLVPALPMAAIVSYRLLFLAATNDQHTRLLLAIGMTQGGVWWLLLSFCCAAYPGYKVAVIRGELQGYFNFLMGIGITIGVWLSYIVLAAVILYLFPPDIPSDIAEPASRFFRGVVDLVLNY